jgi:uncharacterized membrane protein YebE (DUF533 family)
MSNHSSADAVDAMGVLVGKTATYGGGASAFVFGLSANELAALLGVLIALAGLALQSYYNHRRDRRESVESAERIAHMRAGRLEP